jgi:hypothetical protein
MKIYCTGNRNGIGQAVSALLSKEGHEVIGLNRPECDLSVSLDPFIKDDFYVYINNAHYGWSQTDLLYELWERNFQKDCMIINVSTILSDVLQTRKVDQKVWRYPIYKKALDDASLHLQQFESNCRVVLVKPGLMDTGRVPVNGRPILPLDYFAESLCSIITSPSNIYYKVISIKGKS